MTRCQEQEILLTREWRPTVGRIRKETIVIVYCNRTVWLQSFQQNKQNKQKLNWTNVWIFLFVTFVGMQWRKWVSGFLFDYLSSLRKGQITNVDNMTLKRFLFFQLLSFLFSCVSLCTVYLLRWRKEEDILSTWNLSQSGSRYQLFFFFYLCVL